MKWIKSIILLLGIAILAVSCEARPSHHHHKKVPPGHAKKIHGHKSAKDFAPGHHHHHHHDKH